MSHFSFPLDTTKCGGYYGALLTQLISSYTAILIIAVTIFLYIGLCYYIRGCFNSLNADIQNLGSIKNNQSGCFRPMNQKLDSKFIMLVNNHLDIFTLMDKTQYIFEKPFYRTLCTIAFHITHSIHFIHSKVR